MGYRVDRAGSSGFQTGIGRSADGRMSDLFEVTMVARGRENLIFNDARVWRGTNPSIALELLDFRAWPASRPTQISSYAFGRCAWSVQRRRKTGQSIAARLE